MPATPILGFPYPAGEDSPDVPRDIRALAEEAEVDVRTVAIELGAQGVELDALGVEVDTRGAQLDALAASLPPLETLVPSLTFGWSPQSSFDLPRFYKDAFGMITFVGSLSGVGSSSVNAISIPLGWRPAGTIQVPISYWLNPNRVLGTAYFSSVVAVYGAGDTHVPAGTYYAINARYKQGA
jgi:hypothetical protein